MKRSQLTTIALSLVAALGILAGCSSAGSKAGQITIGSKDFTESIILGELVAQYVEGNSAIKVNRKLNLGGSTVTFDGIQRGDLDLYVEYDGTANSLHLKHTEPVTDPVGLYDEVNKELQEKFKLTFTKPFGLNNTYALAMPKALADQYGIKSYSDLAKHASGFIFAANHEFVGRATDGFEPLAEAYGFQFKNLLQMQTGLKYNAIQQGEAQLMNSFATDGKLEEFGMVVLEDDKQFFPPYNGAPLVRQESLEKNPGLQELLDQLGGQISDDEIRQMNFRVEVKEEAVEAVVKDFLSSKRLIK